MPCKALAHLQVGEDSYAGTEGTSGGEGRGRRVLNEEARVQVWKGTNIRTKVTVSTVQEYILWNTRCPRVHETAMSPVVIVQCARVCT